ncbi:MAG: hypothetical protein NTW25_16610 [Candidatus Kapabacteria bacterium]|nr:hypothetical protein [Candidatus Kapabacteria bacterium]
MKKMLIIFLFLNICISNSVPKWEKTKFDFDDVAVRAMVIKDSTLYVNSKQGFYISKDNADSWEKMSTFFNDKASITLATINDTASCLYCNLSTSAVVVNASSKSALDGSVDLSVTGFNCITPTSLWKRLEILEFLYY